MILSLGPEMATHGPPWPRHIATRGPSSPTVSHQMPNSAPYGLLQSELVLCAAHLGFSELLGGDQALAPISAGF